MYYNPNQYSSLSTPDALQGRTGRSPTMASIGANSQVSSLQFLQPNQITSNAHLLAFVKENNATLNFPQKLMLMLSYVDNEKDRGNFITCISWVQDGHAFIIKDRKELVDNLLPLFFREGKFSSFTRKLYRWGFRQICIPKGGNKKDRDLLFGHEHFQRDNKSLMTEMRSVTAAGTRRAIVAMANKKKARKNKEKDGTKKSSPVLVSAAVASMPDNMDLDRASPVSEAKPQSLVQIHLERLLGGPNTAPKSVNTKAQMPLQNPPSLGQNPSTQNALDSLLKARASPAGDTKNDDLVQMHLQRLLGGPNTAAKSISSEAQTPFQTSSSLGQNPSTQNALDSLLKARASPAGDTKQDDLVQMHLQRLLGGPNTAPKSISSEAQTPFQTPASLGQNPSTQNALDSLLKARASPAGDTKQDDLVQMHLQRLLGGPNTAAKSISSEAQTPFQTPASLGQNPSTQNAFDSLLKARASPAGGTKQDDLVQMHLQRLLGGPNTAPKSVNTKAQTPFQTSSSLGQNQSTQNALDSLLKARASPAGDTKKDDLVQMHLQRLLGGPNTAAKSTSSEAQTPFQTPGLRQNSTQTSGYDALLKAKSHSLMPPPVQNKFLGLNDINSLQNHVNYLKAMSQSVAAPSPAPGSAMQPSLCFDAGARIQALRQMDATKQGGSQTVPDSRLGSFSQLSSISQGRALPNASTSLPNSYLELIQGSGGLVGQSAASVPTTVKRVPNQILPETSAPAPRNVIESSNIVGEPTSAAHRRLSSDGIFTKNMHWP